MKRESNARLTVFATLRNHAQRQAAGTLKDTISWPGKPTIQLEQSVTLARSSRLTPRARGDNEAALVRATIYS